MCCHLKGICMNTFTKKNILRQCFASLGCNTLLVWINLCVFTTIRKGTENFQVHHPYNKSKYCLVQYLFQLCLCACVVCVPILGGYVKNLSFYKSSWKELNYGYLLLWLKKHNKSKQQKIITNTSKHFGVLLSWFRIIYYNILLCQPLSIRQSFWEAYYHFPAFFFFSIFELVVTWFLSIHRLSLSPNSLLPTCHLPQVFWPVAFVFTGIYHLGRCLWNDGTQTQNQPHITL